MNALHETADRPALNTDQRKAQSAFEGNATQRDGDPHNVDDDAEEGDRGSYSNGEDAEGEDAGDPELDTSSKSAEESKSIPRRKLHRLLKNVTVFKKKAALDALTSIEKSFATLRDK